MFFLTIISKMKSQTRNPPICVFGTDVLLEYTPRGGGAPFEKLELAFRNQLAQTNGVLFRRPRGTSENRIARKSDNRR